MAKRAEGTIGVRGRMRRQGPLDRFDESVGEDERIAAGSFNMDPGMRAPDEFTDVASSGYRENAKRVAERGGDKQYATSVEEEAADAEADERRKQLMFVLAALIGGGVGGMGASRAMGPGARPGLGVGARNPTQAEWNAMKMRPGRDQAADMMRAKGIKPGYTSGGGFGVADLLASGGHLNRRGRIMNRIEGVLDGGRGARAVDAGALGGMVSPIAYDMIQRRRRGGG